MLLYGETGTRRLLRGIRRVLRGTRRLLRGTRRVLRVGVLANLTIH